MERLILEKISGGWQGVSWSLVTLFQRSISLQVVPIGDLVSDDRCQLSNLCPGGECGDRMML